MVYDGGKRVADVLPSPEVPELDLDPLKEEIRQEVADLRSSGRRFFPDATGDLVPPAVRHHRVFDASSVRPMIALADSFADVGLYVPPMRRFRGVVWRIARFSARLILTLSRFMTDRQRNFNHLTTRSLNNLADGLERSTSDLAEQVQALQELSKRQAEQLASLEAALKGRSQPVDSNRSGNDPDQTEA